MQLWMILVFLGGVLVSATVALVLRQRYASKVSVSSVSVASVPSVASVASVASGPASSSSLPPMPQPEISARPTLRQLGLSIGSLPCGRFNAITDVEGVKVGHSTVSFGDSSLPSGSGPARTGVTAIVPDNAWYQRPSAGAFVLNGNGCMTGLDWIKEAGFLEGPILLTNTLSVGTAYDGAISWMLKHHPQLGLQEDTCLPVVGECDDSSLNDIRGRHVKGVHVLEALESAKSGAVEQGAVGAGTGMICYEFKGGIGTASRVLPETEGGFTVGVLLNCNHGERRQLRVDGVPVGQLLVEEIATEHREGSICIVVATDAPLNSLQLERMAKRAALGLARSGAIAQNESGDFIVAFSTTRTVPREETATEILASRPEVSSGAINPLFEAVVEATEEAVLNALFSARTVVGRAGNVAHELPIEKCLEILRQHAKKI